ncbi:MFS transporter [Herbaspirillum sp. WGmk3]|uniref:MFS transporter n=1 Tax=Herbaspirillum sp. WGmk3 TaxID=2919925 RepID=UPI0020902928|nr:MFS transporter [Herbaspirillum sp. WGmk3]MCO4857263.1 MFS transporter [Herbaspirillum sp. WGmk3]
MEQQRSASASKQAPQAFALFCLASYLLSMSYGTTFLLSIFMGSKGGSDADAGTVISVAMASTFFAVVFSGHVSDAIGAAHAIACAGLLLGLACLGFTMVPPRLLAFCGCALILGLGWGTFYTLGPIIVAMMVPQAHRTKHFALLSGCMMAGIGSGPLIGRTVTASGLTLHLAFDIAAVASMVGAALFWRLAPGLSRRREDIEDGIQGHRLNWSACVSVCRSKAIYSIIMVGLSACIFGGLSSFQTSYAHIKQLDYALFFMGFMCAAIICRLFIARLVVKRDPYIASCVLSAVMAVSVLMLTLFVATPLSYLIAALTLGTGYGLTYSVINGLVVQESPPGLTSQSLLLFSLAYFLGVFGFPWIAGKLIFHWGLMAFLIAVLAIALANWFITLLRLRWRTKAFR